MRCWCFHLVHMSMLVLVESQFIWILYLVILSSTSKFAILGDHWSHEVLFCESIDLSVLLLIDPWHLGLGSPLGAERRVRHFILNKKSLLLWKFLSLLRNNLGPVRFGCRSSVCFTGNYFLNQATVRMYFWRCFLKYFHPRKQVSYGKVV